MPPYEKIELISTTALLNELMRRFDHAAFIGMQTALKKDTDGTYLHGIIRRWAGSSYTVMGLAYDMQQGIYQSIEREDTNGTH